MSYIDSVFLQSEQLYRSSGPSIEELVAKEDIDILPYIGWADYEKEKGKERALELVNASS